ncbi:MAG: putative DNA-binding domain-containing protein [Deltaproteobacteria bacterium]|nr:putative DNA-binding domain-containing protein [Deltaproteobacteria bacterium]
MPPLRDLQQRMFRCVTRAHTEETPELGDLVRAHGALDAPARIAIYARMYCARLSEALAEDYPRVAAVLGPEAFAAAAHRYVAAHPSTHPSLRWFGSGFGAFLEAYPVEGQPPYLADLARLEWARLAVFDAPDAELLELAALGSVPADGWPTTRFAPIPALEVLHAAWPVHRIWEEAPGAEWASGEFSLRVWRQGDRVFQAPMDGIEWCALDHVRAGDDFGAMCVGLAAIVDADQVAATAGGIVLRWIEDGLLRGLPAE